MKNRIKKPLRSIFSVIFILILIAAAFQLVIKYPGSDYLQKTVKQAIADNGLGIEFNELTIDMFSRQAVITDIFAPLPSRRSETKSGSNGSNPAGSFRAESALINFSLRDAAGALLGSPEITKGSLRVQSPILEINGILPTRTRADSISLDFSGSLPMKQLAAAEDDSLSRSSTLARHILESPDEQFFVVRLNNLSVNAMGNTLLPSFLSSLDKRTTPVTGFEIAFISTALLPDIPVTRSFIDLVTTKPVSIDPRQFSRIAEKLTGILGFGTDSDFQTEGRVTAKAKGGELFIGGDLRNEIGLISVNGRGALNAEEIAMSEVTDMSVVITELDADLSEIVRNDNITLTLQSPVILKYLIQGDFSFLPVP